jgi:two-component system chemotaxis response regulator CheB
MKPSTAAGDRLAVLVVDDSAVVRQTLQSILQQDPAIEVAVAADPLFAEQKLRLRRPDVIILDLEMPRMDGMTWLRHLMRTDPIPVVICSALLGRWAEAALRALEEGAVEVIAKPQVGVRSFLEDSGASILDAVRAAAAVRGGPGWLRRRGPSESGRPQGGRNTAWVPKLPRDVRRDAVAGKDLRLVVIGASTGGTEAIRTILEGLPPDCPPIAIVQHMPEGFTAAFAARLDEFCRIEVKEAESGERLVPGRALVARGDHHLVLHRSGFHYLAELSAAPPVRRHRPSVDVLFESAAVTAGAEAVGILLSGMGDDGARGLRQLCDVGAATIAQDEATCVVYGMPREAVKLGAVQRLLPLDQIAAAIVQTRDEVR